MLTFNRILFSSENDVNQIRSFDKSIKSLDVVKIQITNKEDDCDATIFYAWSTEIFKLTEDAELVYIGNVQPDTELTAGLRQPAAVALYKYIVDQVDNNVFNVEFMETKNSAINSFIKRGKEHEKQN